MPVDGGVVPTAEALLPLGVVLDGVVEGGGDVGSEHTEEVENDPYASPVVVGLEAPDEENDADDDTKQNTAAVGECVPDFLFLCIANQLIVYFFRIIDFSNFRIFGCS